MDRRKVPLKVIVLGASGVGKTALMNQYVLKKFKRQYKDAGFLSKEAIFDGTPVTMQIWDTAGVAGQSLGAPLYRGADACVLVYDVGNLQSLQDLEIWREEFLIQARPRDPKHFPFIVLGNKVDKPEAKRRVSKAKAEAWCQQHMDLHHFETSAKSNRNVAQAFQQLVTMALQFRSSPNSEVY